MYVVMETGRDIYKKEVGQLRTRGDDHGDGKPRREK